MFIILNLSSFLSSFYHLDSWHLDRYLKRTSLYEVILFMFIVLEEYFSLIDKIDYDEIVLKLIESN